MSEEEKKAIDDLKRLRKGIEILNQITPEKDDVDIKAINIILNLIEKQQKLINIFIHNEAVKEGKDFNEIKEKYYECL